ncbi:MAG: hypothetical protein Q9212_002559 [Teloschistes hypoglaucus]
MAHYARGTDAIDPEKQGPFAPLDGRQQSNTTGESLVTVETLRYADEALFFLENHPRSTQIAEEGNAILQDPQQLKKLVRKIDLTIASLLACVYFLQVLDKTTLSYTAVMGIRTDTHLKGQNYSDLSMLFYIGTKYSSVRDAFQDREADVVAPILVLIIAMWYKKNEQGRRVSWFYVCNSLTHIFGGCVAYGVSFASTGFATWRIFYIAIGALTMVVGALVAVFLPDSPVKARRFTDAEKVAALMRDILYKWRDRSLVMIIVIIPTILFGCLMIGLDPNGVPKNKGGLLAASFLSGTFGAAFMLLLAWNASNIAGHSKKVTANALTLVTFAVGNILGTQTFQQKEAPGYKSGRLNNVTTNPDDYDTFLYRIPYSNIDISFIVWLKKPVDHQSLGLAILSGQRYIRNRIISQGERWLQAEDDPFVSIIPDQIWLRNDSAKTSSGRCKMTYVTLLRVYEAYMTVLYEGKRSLEASMQVRVANVVAGHAALSKELKTRLEWSSVYEAGKFYDRQSTDRWYYYVYGQPKGKSEGKKKNEALSKSCGCDVYGDAAVIRSGPGGESIPENFTSVILAKALAFYETESSSAVFAERERSRMSRKMGIDLSGVPAMHQHV